MDNIIDSTINKYSLKKSGHKKFHQVIVKDYFNDANKSYNKLQKNEIKQDIANRSNDIFNQIHNFSLEESDIKDKDLTNLEKLIANDVQTKHAIALLGNKSFAKQMLYYLCYGKLITIGLSNDSQKNIANSNDAFKVICNSLPSDIREHFLAAVYHRNSYNRVDWIPFKKSHHITKTAEIFIQKYLLRLNGDQLIDEFCNELITKPEYYKGNRTHTISKLKSLKSNKINDDCNLKRIIDLANNYMTSYINMGVQLLKQDNFDKQIDKLKQQIKENENKIRNFEKQISLIVHKMTNLSITSDIVQYLITKNFDKDFSILQNIQFNGFLTSITNQFLENKSYDRINAYKDDLLKLNNRIIDEIKEIENDTKNLNDLLNLYNELNNYYKKQSNNINLNIKEQRRQLKNILEIQNFSNFIVDNITKLTTANTSEQIIDNIKNGARILVASISSVTVGIVTYFTSKLITNQKFISGIVSFLASLATYKGVKKNLTAEYHSNRKDNDKLIQFDLALNAKSNLENYKELLLKFEELVDFYQQELENKSIKHSEFEKEYIDIIDNEKFKNMVDTFLIDYNNYYTYENVEHKKEKELINLIITKFNFKDNNKKYFIDNLFTIIDKYNNYNPIINNKIYLQIQNIANLLNKSNIPARSFQHDLLYHALNSKDVVLVKYENIPIIKQTIELYKDYNSNENNNYFLDYRFINIIKLNQLNNQCNNNLETYLKLLKKRKNLQDEVDKFVNQISSLNAQGTIFEQLINVMDSNSININYKMITQKIKELNPEIVKLNSFIECQNKKDEWVEIDAKLTHLYDECHNLINVYNYNDEITTDENNKFLKLQHDFNLYKSQPLEDNIKRFETLITNALTIINNCNNFREEIVTNYFNKLTEKFPTINLLQDLNSSNQNIIFASKLYKSITTNNKNINLFDINYLNNKVKKSYTKTISDIQISKNLELNYILPIINTIHNLNNHLNYELKQGLKDEIINNFEGDKKNKVQEILEFINILQNENYQILYDNKVPLISILYNSNVDEVYNETIINVNNNEVKKMFPISSANNGVFSFKTLSVLAFNELDKDDESDKDDLLEVIESSVEFDDTISKEHSSNSSLLMNSKKYQQDTFLDSISISRVSNETIQNKFHQYENLLNSIFNPNSLDTPGYASLIFRLIEVHFRLDKPNYSRQSIKVQLYFKYIESSYGDSFDKNEVSGVLKYLEDTLKKYTKNSIFKNELWIEILNYTINKINVLLNDFIFNKIVFPATNLNMNEDLQEQNLANDIKLYYSIGTNKTKLSLSAKLIELSNYRHLKLYKSLRNYDLTLNKHDAVINLANLMMLLSNPNNYLDIHLLLFITILQAELSKLIKVSKHVKRGSINYANLISKSFHRAINDLPQYIYHFLNNVELVEQHPHLFDAIQFTLLHLFNDNNVILLNSNYIYRNVASQVISNLDILKLNSNTDDQKILAIKKQVGNIKISDNQNKILISSSIYKKLEKYRELLLNPNINFHKPSIINSIYNDLENIFDFNQLIERIKKYLTYNYGGNDFDILQVMQPSKINNNFQELIHNITVLLMLYKKISLLYREDENISKKLIFNIINKIPANKFIENDYSLKYIYQQVFLNLKDTDFISYEKIFDGAVFFEKSLILNSEDKLNTFEFIFSLVSIEVKKDNFVIPDNYSNTNLEFFREHLNEFFRESRKLNSSGSKSINESLQKLGKSRKLSDDFDFKERIIIA
jgi:hypothetical protein